MTTTQLENVLNQAKRIQKTPISQRRRRYEEWQPKARALLMGDEDVPPLAWTYERLSRDIAVISAVLKTTKPSPPPPPPSPVSRASEVFVVCGRNEHVRQSMFAFLRALELQPMEWTQALNKAPDGSPVIARVLRRAFDSAGAIVVLLTPDDEAQLREQHRSTMEREHESRLLPQPRPNVLFEAGMAFGRHPKKTVLVQVGENLRPVSDIVGCYVLRLDDSIEKRKTFIERLKHVGCPVQDQGSDWIKTGSFQAD
jgi:predicted nucleotide-binding protein